MKKVFSAALSVQVLVFALMVPGLCADGKTGIHFENNEF
jgi:hypothetical protein